MNNPHKCKCTFNTRPLCFGCPCYNSSKVQNLVWWKLHIVRLPIPPTEGDLRDLLWHSICAPKREIQIHLAGRSAGSVWGNPISHNGTPHPEREPSFHSGTVSAKWTPQPRCAAVPWCIDRAQRLWFLVNCLCCLMKSKWSKDVGFISWSILLKQSRDPGDFCRGSCWARHTLDMSRFHHRAKTHLDKHLHTLYLLCSPF